MVAAQSSESRERWIACPDCDTLHRSGPVSPHHEARCVTCGCTLLSRTALALDRPLAFALAGLILFIPANLYAIVTFSFHGVRTDNILLTGVMELAKGGQTLVAILVFLASILFPAIYLMGIVYTVLCARINHFPADYAWSLKMTQKLYRWGMIDVYLLACLISFIKLGQLASVLPGPGLYCLGGVLLCTLLASVCFDTDLLWERFGARSKDAGNWSPLKSYAK